MTCWKLAEVGEWGEERTQRGKGEGGEGWWDGGCGGVTEKGDIIWNVKNKVINLKKQKNTEAISLL